MLEVAMLPAASADDATLADALCQVVNEAYEVAEAEIWRQSYPRTSVREVSAAIRDGQAVAARLSGRLVGSVFLRKLDSETGWFGALAVTPAHSGHGIGRELVAFAERWARSARLTRMQLEVLIPVEAEIAYSQRLAHWYRRLGYREVSHCPLEEIEPGATPFLATPCQVVIHIKPLGPERIF